ncbi:Abi-alpha family protein [Parabacteroides goldsteinii]|uniref:Abi-alpha family protein n=1 Tax=Parabacteroides goldsteinii TaxID=328812 RepID=UPI002047CF58|nr:MAG TPA: Protein of unknown function (DUF2806) [Caudoviricetes sp.]
MMDKSELEKSSPLVGDLLGVAPYAKTVNMVAEASVDGIKDFLSLTCRPLLEELGLWGRDKVRIWRLKNLCSILQKAEGKIVIQDGEIMMANPRVGFGIAENASLVEDEELQNMWAGLFSSSITADGKDDSNLIFINLLKQLTVIQARILNYVFENCLKVKFENNLFLGCKYCTDLNTLFEICQISDLDRIDRELDALHSLGLLAHGLFVNSSVVDLTLKSLAIHLIARCKGIQSVGSSLDFISQEEYETHPEYRPTNALLLGC